MRSLEEIVAMNEAVKPRELFGVWDIENYYAHVLLHVCDSGEKADRWIDRRIDPNDYVVVPLTSFDLD